MVIKALVIWSVIATAEVVHGILRVKLLNRRVGDHRARQIAVLTGSALILCIVWLTLPWLGPLDLSRQLAVGGLWLVLMLAFEITLGRVVFRVPWKRIAADFDFRQGGLLALGMLVLFLSPLIVTAVRYPK